MRVQMILEALDRASAPIRAVRDAVGGLNDVMKQAATTERLAKARENAAAAQAQAHTNMIGATAAMAAVTAPIAKAVKAWNEYEDVLTDVALKADLSGKSLENLSERIRSLSKNLMVFSSVELTKAMDQMAAGGLDLSAAEGSLEAVAKAARATKASIEDLGTTTVTLIKNMKVAPEEVRKALDIMAQAGKEGQFELKDMARYFSSLGSTYAGMGQTGVKSVADLAAVLQVIRSQTGTAESAVRALEDLLNKNTLGPAAKKFEELGVDINAVMEEGQKTGRVFEALYKALNAATGGDANKLKQIFGDKQALNAARALLQNYEDFIKIRDKALAAQGTVDRDFATRMGLGVEKVRALTVAYEELSVTLGQIFAPTLAAKAEMITKALWSLNEFAKANPQLVSALASTLAAITGLLVVLAAGRLALAALRFAFVPLIGLFWKMTAAGRNLAIIPRIFAMMVSPIRLAWTVLSGFIGGFVSAVGAGVAAAGGWSAVLALLAARVTGAARAFAAGIMLVSRAMMTMSIASLANPVGLVLAGIVAIAAAAYLIYRNWGSIGPWLAGIWDTIKASALALWTGITEGVSAAVETVRMAFSDMGSAIAGWWNGLPSLNWSSLIPTINWSSWFSFSWSDVLPSWNWSDIIPSMPDFRGWFSGPKTSLADALPSDPAKLQAVARATAAIRSDVGAIAAIDTAAVMTSVGTLGTKAAEVRAMVDAVLSAARVAVDQASRILSAANFHSHGVAMMKTLADGIRAGSAAAVAAVQATVQQIRDHLPHSPAKIGPLSDLDKVQFGQTLAGAIRAGTPAALAAAHALALGLAAALPASPGFAAQDQGAAAAGSAPAPSGGGVTVAGGITVSVSFSPTISGNGDIVAQIKAALPSLGYEIGELVKAELARRERVKH